jgi:hypothetical protein
VAEEMLRAKQNEQDRARSLGVPVERLQARAQPLSEWLDDYEPAVRSGRSPFAPLILQGFRWEQMATDCF